MQQIVFTEHRLAANLHFRYTLDVST